MIATVMMIVALVQAGGEPQWILRQMNTHEPVAVFLSWDYSSVILRARCARGRTVIDYHHHDARDHDVALIVDEGRHPLQREADGEGFVLDDAAVQALTSGQWVALDAPLHVQDMDEPWYLGRALVLRELASLCHAGNAQ